MFCQFFCISVVFFCSRKCLAKIIIFLGVLLRSCVFQWCCAYYFAYLLIFCSRKCFGKIVFLGLVFEIHCRERAFVFVVLLRSSISMWCFSPMLLHICWGFCSRKCLAKLAIGASYDFWKRGGIVRSLGPFFVCLCFLAALPGIKFCLSTSIFYSRNGDVCDRKSRRFAITIFGALRKEHLTCFLSIQTKGH